MAISTLCAIPAFPQQASLWTNSETPATAQFTGDSAAVNLGLKFNSDTAGSVVAIRFFKGQYNKGPHTVDVWSASGQKLAEAQSSNETATGWQQVTLGSPVHIAAKTDYMVSYLAANGNYAVDKNYAWSSRNAPPLHPSGSAPGMFTYSGNVSFPTSSYNASNYWVDLLFVPDSSSSSSPSGTYTISGKVTGPKAMVTLSGAASGSASTDSSGNFAISGLKNGTYLAVPSASGYSFSPASASVTVNGANVGGILFAGTAIPAAPSHSVTLSWTGSVSLNISGYRVYRSSLAGGPYSLLNPSLITNNSYTDSTVDSGKTYYYVSTSVDSSNAESTYSNETSASIP